jgi:hypothetical protein
VVQVVRQHGRALQVEPMTTVLKPPGSTLLKLGYDGPLSNFAYNLNLRRYNTDVKYQCGAAQLAKCDKIAADQWWGGAA